MRDWVGVLACALGTAAARRPRLILYFGYAPGDDLLFTAVLRELRQRGRTGLMMVSNHAGLFVGNDDVDFVRPLWRRYSADASTIAICRRLAWLWGAEFCRPHYAPLAGPDRSTPPRRHIITELCAGAGVTGAVTIRPYLTLEAAEREQGAWAEGRIAIQSSGMAGRQPIRNKQWPAERFQGVVEALRDEVEFIQLGSQSDPPLHHATDLRGRTGMREAAAILHHARLYIGTVGFLMHLARAVECPSVIIFGGREAPWQSGYACNANLYSAVPCAPCWRWNGCDYHRRCLDEIAVEDVVAAVRRMLAQPRAPLAAETVEIAPSASDRSRL